MSFPKPAACLVLLAACAAAAHGQDDDAFTKYGIFAKTAARPAACEPGTTTLPLALRRGGSVPIATEMTPAACSHVSGVPHASQKPRQTLLELWNRLGRPRVHSRPHNRQRRNHFAPLPCVRSRGVPLAPHETNRPASREFPRLARRSPVGRNGGDEIGRAHV